ncbi:MAG: hypothetical protein JSR99_09715 [Proteobacteria bacterium]|nr:hypothetical protein [Pseudomonadota bacterium]
MAKTVRRTAARIRSITPADDEPEAPAKPSKSSTKSQSAVPPSKAKDETPTKNDAPSPRPAAGSRNASRRAPTKKSLVQRVYNTIDGELTKLEKQKGLTSQDRERASRALSQMVNALEKAVEMQREMTKTKRSGGDAKSKEALAHAEDLRREIAERLERLNRKRASSRSSE